MWVPINGLSKPSLWAPGHVTKMLQAKNGQKVDDLEPIRLCKYRCEFCLFILFVSFENDL